MGDALPKTKTHHTLKEYEALVRNAGRGERYEYYNGMIIPLSEYTTLRHNRVVHNAADLLKVCFYPQGCWVYTGNARLAVEEGKEYRLPDVVATCSERDLRSESTIQNPVMLVEVLLPGTAMRDVGPKTDAYRKTVSLQADLIVNPREVWVRVCERNVGGDWLPDRSSTSRSETFTSATLNLQVSLAELYRFVTIPNPEPDRKS